MKRLKTRAELDQEQRDAIRYALGNVTLDTTRLLLIYARQSTSKQSVSNIYSAMEQRDGLLERAGELGWTCAERRILFVENQLAKKTHVSGSLRVDQRPGLKALWEVIETGKASAVLVVGVDRLTRDEDLITPTAFANLCKRHHVLIITDDYIFDFNNPNRDDMGRFMNEAIAAKEYVRKQIKGKMLKNRTRKANMGRVANGIAPVGLRLDESRDNLIPSSHAERVDWLYGRFRAHGANLASLLREIIDMAKAGIPLFPVAEDIDPKTIYLKRVYRGQELIGWTISTRFGLKYVLTNPMYQGHLVFNGRIVKRSAHKAIVDADNWQYAFCHLSDVDLDGSTIEHPIRTVRYSQAGSTNTALLTGIRHNGRAVIDGVSGGHVYLQLPQGYYVLKNRTGLSTTGFETSISIKHLDSIVEARVLYWLRASERACLHYDCGQAPHIAMAEVEQTTPPIVPGVDDLTLTRQELARVERALRTSADVMDDNELRETYAKQARLLKRQAGLVKAQEQKARLEREREQAKNDMQDAPSKWEKWDLEKRRQFIRLVTEAITLEEIAEGWLRLTLVWSPIMGFIYPMEGTMRAMDIAYLWRAAGSEWTTEEVDVLRKHYATATRGELQRMLPARSWVGIVRKSETMRRAGTIGLSRPFSRSDLDIPPDVSLRDLEIVAQYALQPGKRVQWKHDYLMNGDGLS